MGRIGQGIAKRGAHGFGMKVIYHNRSSACTRAGSRVQGPLRDKEELLRTADHLVLVLPYSAASHHAIGAAELALMKPTATLVNIARGGIVDDAALAVALREKRIAAAGLDVFEGEPKVHPDLLTVPNVVLTPAHRQRHVPTRLAMANLAADNLIGFLTQGKPLTPLNPQGFTQATSHSLEAVRQAVDEKLAQAVAESRTGRTELLAAFAAFEAQLAQRLTALDAAQSLALSSFRTELTGTLGTMSGALRDQLDGNGNQIKQPVLGAAGRRVAATRFGLVQGSQQNAEQLRTALNERLAAIQADNATKLEEMRRTVDEKLHATLEQRLGESFKLVSDRLEQVHKGLGEMQTLASSVGDLKRVMTNVKSRGTWGEMQLGAIIDNVLTPDQYAKQRQDRAGQRRAGRVRHPPAGQERRAPGVAAHRLQVPVEQYQRLMDAQDAADKAAILSAGNAFETSIKLEAKKIFSQIRLAAAHH
jgi:hypothetical protein